MAAYLQVYDSCHLQADGPESGSAAEPYARQSSMGYLYLFTYGHTSVLLWWHSDNCYVFPVLWMTSYLHISLGLGA